MTNSFERVATRVTQRLGFRWFAYLRIVEDAPKLISSYPKSWTGRYFDLHYEQLDPVVRRARLEHDLFSWGSGASTPAGTREQRKFFEEATTFGIESGVTVPIRGGFGRMAAFTLATDDRAMRPERLVAKSKDVVQLVGLYFHTHAAVRLGAVCDQPDADDVLTQRERQCLAWAARGRARWQGVFSRPAPSHLTRHLLFAVIAYQATG